MAESKILDPFKPAQPRIPGVSSPDEEPSEGFEPEGEYQQAPEFIGPPRPLPRDTSSLRKLLWVGLTLAVALAACILFFSWKRKSALAGPLAAGEPANPDPLISETVRVDPRLRMGPGSIATTAQLPQIWSSKRFYFRDPATLKPVPAMVVRLPGGAFWGFSLREPFGNCELEYVTDLKMLRTRYGFEAAYPMVADPCNGTVFDLTHYGNAPSGLVRGEIAKGAGLRPPLAIEVRIEGNQVVATRMEQ